MKCANLQFKKVENTIHVKKHPLFGHIPARIEMSIFDGDSVAPLTSTHAKNVCVYAMQMVSAHQMLAG